MNVITFCMFLATNFNLWQAGIHILYFLDYVVSCGWWLMIIQLVQVSSNSLVSSLCITNLGSLQVFVIYRHYWNSAGCFYHCIRLLLMETDQIVNYQWAIEVIIIILGSKVCLHFPKIRLQNAADMQENAVAGSIEETKQNMAHMPGGQYWVCEFHPTMKANTSTCLWHVLYLDTTCL